MADQQFIQYVAIDGDRWDVLADIAYGDETLFAPIIAANPSIPIDDTIAAGTPVFVPIIELPAPVNNLPPWLKPL